MDPQLVTDPSRRGTDARPNAPSEGQADPVRCSRRAWTSDGAPIHFVYVQRGVDLSTARTLQDGISPASVSWATRGAIYPAGSLAPQVLGFVGVDGTGLAGLEKQYQKLLAGRAGHEIVQEDRRAGP